MPKVVTAGEVSNPAVQGRCAIMPRRVLSLHIWTPNFRAARPLGFLRGFAAPAAGYLHV